MSQPTTHPHLVPPTSTTATAHGHHHMAAAAAPVRMAEAVVNPNFDLQGLWDVCLPLVLCMWALGAVFKALEKRLYLGLAEGAGAASSAHGADGDKRKGGRNVTHVFCTGVVARVLLLLLPWAPLPFLRTRWDWVCTAPTVYETLAHLYHWRDTTDKLKWSLLGHHAVVLLVVWPLARLAETVPYPVSALSMPLFFEVGSAWSYLSYLVKSRGPRVLDALGLRQMEGLLVPSLICLCYWGQRAMRAAALWQGVVFLHDHPEFNHARPLQLVMIALELHGGWRCFKHLPHPHPLLEKKDSVSMSTASAPVEPVVEKIGTNSSSSSSSRSSSSKAGVKKQQMRPQIGAATGAGRASRSSMRFYLFAVAST